MPTLALNQQQELQQFCQDILHGLRAEQKSLPCKYFYDARGSELFDRICELPEYYPTRTERSILCSNRAEIAARIGPNAALLEYGSGSSTKTRILLDSLHKPAAYIPLDISREHLSQSALALQAEFPHIPVLPVCADYTQEFELPEVGASVYTAFFPGSTIGNFTPSQAVRFLRGVANVVGRDGGLLIGVDVWKSPEILIPAYNDAAGITAQFNLNLLERMNRELEGDFDLDAWRHEAVWNPEGSRIEMHLVSTRDQSVGVAGERFQFHEGESILTEYSHKWKLETFALMAHRAGWRIERVWFDDQRLFSVQYLRAC